MRSPLQTPTLFFVGSIPITEPVVVTWGIVVAMALASMLAGRRLSVRPGSGQALLETLIDAIGSQLSDAMGADARRFFPLLATLFVFLVVANVSGLIPGITPPTAFIQTPAALAIIVFFAVHYYGVRSVGLAAYLKSFTRPTILMLPLNVLGQITRTFSLMIRLFGNIMSGEFVIGIVLAFAGLFVPIPLLALEVVVGVVQAYIFTVLAAVFIAAGVGAVET
ncbi:MAG TPA: F0F1 ATP synthase subunit A [Candidatus Binataceae bacterium]